MTKIYLSTINENPEVDCSRDVLQICKIYWLQFLLFWKPTKVDLDSLDKTGMSTCHWHLVSLGCDSTEYFCHGVAGYLLFRWIS